MFPFSRASSTRPLPQTFLTVPCTPQEMVYEATTKSLIEGVISGYNATVFAYGPTGMESGLWAPLCPTLPPKPQKQISVSALV